MRKLVLVGLIVFAILGAKEGFSAVTDIDHFRISTPNTLVTAGVVFNITVTAEDASNAVVIDYIETPLINLSAGIVTPDSIFFTVADAGVHTEGITVTQSGTITLTVIDRTTSDSYGTIVLSVISDVPVLTEPVYGTETNHLRPNFKWQSVEGADSYEIIIDNDTDFLSPIIDSIALVPNYTPSQDLPEDTYYWRVRAYELDIGYFGACSESFVLQIDTTPPPKLTGLHGEAYSDSVLLTWDYSTASDSDGYFVYRSLYGANNYVRLNTAPLTIAQFYDTTVVVGLSYDWVVRVRDIATNLSDTSDSTGAPKLSVTKHIDTITLGGQPSDTRPGATVLYRISVKNIGFSPSDTAQVIDYITRFTTYLASSMSLDTGIGIKALTDALDYDEGDFNISNPNSISIKLDFMDVSDTADIRFKVTID